MCVKVVEFKNLDTNPSSLIIKEPTRIYSFTTILLIFIIVFIILGSLFSYNKSTNYVATIINEEELYFKVTISNADLKEIDKSTLIIENKKYNFHIINIEKNDYDNNYNILLSINLNINNLQDQKYIIFTLKKEKTTFFKEILKRIKEDLN